MAKQSLQTRKRNKDAAEAKTKKAKAVKATKLAAVASANTELQRDNVTVLPTSAKKDVTPYDTSIALSAPIDDRTSGNKPKHQRLKATDEQVTAVTRMMESNDFEVTLADVGRDIQKLQWRIAAIAVALCARLQRDKQAALPLLEDFLKQVDSLGKGWTMIRTGPIRNWFLHFGPVKYAKPSEGEKKAWLIDDSKHRKFAGQFGRSQQKYLTDRIERPFWMLEPEREFQSFDFMKAVQDLLNKAKKYDGYSDEKKKEVFGKDGLHLEGLEAVKKAFASVKKTEVKKDDSSTDDNSEHEETSAAA